MGRRTWFLLGALGLGIDGCASTPAASGIERVGRGVESVRRDLALCYHDAQLSGIEVRGTDFVVTIDFAEDPPGLRVRDAELLAPSLERCVLAALRRVDFPSLDPTTIDVPIRAPR